MCQLADTISAIKKPTSPACFRPAQRSAIDGLPCPDAAQGIRRCAVRRLGAPVGTDQSGCGEHGCAVSISLRAGMGYIFAGEKATTSLAAVRQPARTFDGLLVGSSLVMFMRNLASHFHQRHLSGIGSHNSIHLRPQPRHNLLHLVESRTQPAQPLDTAGVLSFSAAGTGKYYGGGSNAPSLQSIVIAPSTTVLQGLASQQYQATCTYSDGSTANCTSSVTWASSTVGVATINNSGLATGVAQGSATITATSNSIQAQAAVTVPAATLQTITETPGSVTVPVGSTQQFKATGIYSDSSTTDVTNS